MAEGSTPFQPAQGDDVLPAGPLVAYYGDDLTGSTDVMEVMTFAGLPTVLFLDVPTTATLQKFAGYRCVGIAGLSRSRDPAWMDRNLPQAFAALAGLCAPILQYKVCSTFDSAPHVGSIGRAIDIGLAAMPAAWSPVIVGAPRLRRYQAFGNLFAGVDGEGYRIDRHPTMARHPVTPMHEADLRLHLARQTDAPIGLVDYVALKAGQGRDQMRALRDHGKRVLLIDVLDDDTQVAAGRLVWDERSAGLFTASSSGLEYALVAYWHSAGLLPRIDPPRPADRVDTVAVVSGSCSPVTARQIEWAGAHGFAPIRLAVDGLHDIGSRAAREEIGRATQAALSALGDGLSPLVFSALGPDDPAIARFAAATAGRRDAGNDDIGEALGRVLAGIVAESGVRRLAIAGGDSAGRAAAHLGITALTAMAPLMPGSPLCCALSDDPARQGLEIAFKGGQIGDAAFFGTLRNGRPLNARERVSP